MPRSPFGFALPLLLSLAVATPFLFNPAEASARATQTTAQASATTKTSKAVAKTASKATTAKVKRRGGKRVVAGAAAVAGAAGAATAFRPVHAHVLMDAQTGRIIEAGNADVATYPASLTKMMTLLLTFEALEKGNLRLDQELPVSRHASNQKPSRLNLIPGTTIRVEEAILALTVKSANDAAVVLSEALGGSEDRFAEMMTAKAHSLGMTNTTFRNASGLPNREQRTTARDMAKLARAVVNLPPQEYAYFARTRFDWNGTVIPGHNRLFGRVEGYDGIKTGFINLSGFNLAGSASRNGQRMIAVVLGGTTAKARDHEVAELLEKGFKSAAPKQTIAVTDAKLPQ